MRKQFKKYQGGFVGLLSAGIGLMSSMNQGSAQQQAGQDQLAASKYSSDRQYQAFNEQQQAALQKYMQSRQDVSGLFGNPYKTTFNSPYGSATYTPGSMGAAGGGGNGLFTPNASASGSPLSRDQLRQQLLSQYTKAPEGSGPINLNSPMYQSISDLNNLTPYIDPATGKWDQVSYMQGGQGPGTVDEAGLNAEIERRLAAQGQQAGAGSGGLFGGNGGSGTDASLTATLDPRYAALHSEFQDVADQNLSYLKQFNPDTMSQNIYDKLSKLGEYQRNKDSIDLENRLSGQGLLTSSIGSDRFGVLKRAQNDEDLQREVYSMTNANSMLDQIQNRATGATQAAIGIGGLPIQQALAAANISNSDKQQMLQALGITAGVPINGGTPPNTGAVDMAGAQAAAKGMLAQSNIQNTFWSSLAGNQNVQNALGGLFSNNSSTAPNYGYGTLGSGFYNSSPISTAPVDNSSLFGQLGSGFYGMGG